MIDASEVAPAVFRIVEESDGRLLCMYLLVGENRSLLVDIGLASTPARTLAPAFDQLGFDVERLDYVLVTHADVDHCGGLGSVQRMAPSSRAICGTGDRDLIENIELMIERRYREFRDIHGIDQTSEFCAWVRDEADPGRVDVELSGARLRLSADWDVRIIHAPGHSRGHLVVLDERSQTLIIGDAVLGQATPLASGEGAFAPTYRHVDDYRATIDRLRATGARRVLSAHNRVIEGDDVAAFWAKSEQFCATLEQALLEQLTRSPEPMTTGSLISGAAERVRTWPPDADPTLAYPVVGHLESLRRRGVIDATSGTPVRWTARAGRT